MVLICFVAFFPVSSPRRFRAKVLSPNQLQVSWKEPKGEFEGYRVLYSAEPGEIQVQILAELLLVPSVQEPSRFNASTKISSNHKRLRFVLHCLVCTALAVLCRRADSCSS